MLLEQHRKIVRELEDMLRHIKESPASTRNALIEEVKAKLDEAKLS